MGWRVHQCLVSMGGVRWVCCVIIGRESSVVAGGGSAWLRCGGGSIDRSDSWVAYVVVDDVVMVLAGVRVGGEGGRRALVAVLWVGVLGVVVRGLVGGGWLSDVHDRWQVRWVVGYRWGCVGVLWWLTCYTRVWGSSIVVVGGSVRPHRCGGLIN